MREIGQGSKQRQAIQVKEAFLSGKIFVAVNNSITLHCYAILGHQGSSKYTWRRRIMLHATSSMKPLPY
jgi:hypothetical protein